LDFLKILICFCYFDDEPCKGFPFLLAGIPDAAKHFSLFNAIFEGISKETKDFHLHIICKIVK